MSSRTPVAVAAAALLLAATSTSYAAGLARGSVDTQHLKAGAVTGAKVRDGSLGRADLAPTAVPHRTRTISRDLPGEVEAPLLTLAGVAVVATCRPSEQLASVRFADPGGSDLEVSGHGIRTYLGAPVASSILVDGLPEHVVHAKAPNPGVAVSTFDGTVRVGTGVPLRVSLSVLATTYDGRAPCKLRLQLTPLT